MAGIEDASQRALAKLEQVLPSRLRKRLKALRGSIVRLADTGPTVDLRAVASLSAACTENVEAIFPYRDHGGSATERRVEPHRLVHMERRWYLVAWDTKRRDWRTFRVDRITLPITTGASFTPRSAPDDDVAAYVTRSVSAAPYPHRARVVVHTSYDELRARIPPSAGLLEAIDPRSCRFHVGASSLESMAAWLALLGADFTVEDPPELAGHLRALSERLARAAAR